MLLLLSDTSVFLFVCTKHTGVGPCIANTGRFNMHVDVFVL